MKTIQIIIPPNLEPDDLQNLLYKATAPTTLKAPPPNLNFSDPIITLLAKRIMKEHNSMYTSLKQEIATLLKEDLQ